MAGVHTLTDIGRLADKLTPTTRMPVLFLGHGSPMNAIEENQFVQGFRKVATTLPKPRAILCISAHWYVRGTRFTAMDMPRTIHDFGGFPEELYRINYPVKGSPELASEAAELLKPVEVSLDHQWGLDHGAWTVIRHMYPDADIPVIQMSIDSTRHASYHYELAGRLALLRDKGILIIGSGNLVHNLGLVDWPNMNKVGHGYDWAKEARKSMNNWILEGNVAPLINYTSQGRAFQLAIPSPDHYLPLLYTLGLRGKQDQVSLFNDELLAGSLSMTSLKITS